MNPILFFDSDCLVCNRFIQFIIRRDRSQEIYFSDFHSKLAKENQFDTSMGMIFWKENKLYFGAQAFREIMKSIQYSKALDFLLKIIPNKIQDLFYGFIMQNRLIFNNSKMSCVIRNERFIQ